MARREVRIAPEDETAVTDLQMMAELANVLKQLPSIAGLPAAAGQPDDLAHDAYFHIERVDSVAPEVFGRVAIEARLIFLREASETQVNVSSRVLATIDRALADFSACVAGGAVNGTPCVTRWELGGTERNARQRWIRGHQIFAALTQGLIFSFRELGQALRAGRSREVQRWADLCISLLRGSEATFEFTGDFEAEEYASTLRPSMMPPFSEVGLSGLMSVDHRFLVQTMRDMRPALKSLYEHEQERHDGISRELEAVYDSHILVCERFVGKKPSILTAARTERSGPSLIEQFKILRLKPFEQTARTARLTAGCPISKKL